jgi:acetyl esterase/lipase
MPFNAEDLEFLRLPAGSLSARWYRPEGQGPFPAVVEVHGGAWTSGDRFNNVVIAEYLASLGIVVLSIDFRMPPAAGYPDTVADVNFGVRFLKAHAERFSTRPDWVGGLGTSSGGHLLLLNALRPTDPRYAAQPLPENDAALAFAIACWPVADPLARYRAVSERDNQRLVEAHHQFWPSVDAMAEGSPQLILERGETVERPPSLIMQGTADDNLTPDMARNFAAAFADAGGAISYHEFAGEPHAFIPRNPTSANARLALGLIAHFIRCHVG